MKKSDCATVMELVDDWAHWRKGQCDFPDGLSEVEKKLLSASEVKKEKRMSTPRYMIFGHQVITDVPLTEAQYGELIVPFAEAQRKAKRTRKFRFYAYINGRVSVVEDLP